MITKEESNITKTECEVLDKKLNELSDEEMSSVNGGFGDTSIYYSLNEGTRVKVRYHENYYNEKYIYAYGTVICRKSRTAKEGSVLVRLDGWSTGKSFNVRDIEIVE